MLIHGVYRAQLGTRRVGAVGAIGRIEFWECVWVVAHACRRRSSFPAPVMLNKGKQARKYWCLGQPRNAQVASGLELS